MSDRYKKYFDNISPDEKLVEKTKQKMLDELYKKNKVFNIRYYAAVAACLAFVISAVVLAPSLVNSPLKHGTETGTHAAAEHITESTVTDVCETSPPSEKETDACTDITSVCQNDTEKIYLTTLVSSAETENSHKDENTFSESMTSTESDIVTDITSLSHAPETSEIPETSETYFNTQTTEGMGIPISAIEGSEFVTVTVYSSSDLILRPGVSETTDITAECTTTVTQHTDLTEMTSVSYDTSEFCSEIDVDGRTIFLNMGFEYEYNFPAYAQKVSMENARTHFGKSFVPPPLLELYPQETGYANKYDRDYSEGICYVFGEETYIDKLSGRFVSMTVSNSETSYGYNISCIRPVSTVINGEEYIFGTMEIYKNVYFCQFIHDEIYYKFLFKGYSAEEMMEIILALYT